MSLDSQDFVTGLDFTALSVATGADHNAIIEASHPLGVEGDDSQGAGLTITTRDTVIDTISTPNVPDPDTDASTLKWKRYIWVRKSQDLANNFNPILYTWNDSIDSDPTYLKWVNNAFNAGPLTSLVANAQSDATDALTLATIANANADTANTNATAAVTTANNVSAAVAGAISTANAASTLATTANTNANAAVSTANTASTVASNALAVANAPKTLAQITQGTAGQRIRTKEDATTLEYYNKVNTLAYFSETVSAASVFASIINGFNIRVLNTKVDPGNIISSFSSNAFTPIAGVYRINCRAPYTGVTNALVKAYLYNITTSTVSIEGTMEIIATSGLLHSFVIGTFVANGTDQFGIYCDAATGSGTARGGTASNTTVNVGMLVELELIG